MNIFEFLLAPFIYLIKQIFLLSYSITGNYGLSIVFLSFSVSLLLLPVFMFIEKNKKKDDRIKLKMKPFIDEIKRCYKGQERYYYLKTLNRQYHYNAIRSLIPTLSLILQIPFFIAAYQFLENFAPLSGVPFLFIRDLNLPDGLWGTINILPIAMTLFNLITAFFYTRNGNISELKQMIIVAAVFLILLFNLPAGLVLYWTMNNLFSFFRLFITNPEVFKKNENRKHLRKIRITEYKNRAIPILPKLRLTFLIIFIFGSIFQLNEAISNGFENYGLEIIKLILTSILAILLIGILTLVHKTEVYSNDIKGTKRFIDFWPNFRPMFIIFSLITIGSQINWAIQLGFHSIVQRIVIAIIGSTAITLILAFIILFYQGQFSKLFNKYQLEPSTFERKHKVLFVIIASLLTVFQGIEVLLNDSGDILIKLFGSLFFSWIIVVFITNRKIIITKKFLARISDIYQYIRVSPLFFLSILFLSIYFFFAGNYYFTGESNSINIIGLIITLIGQFLGFSFFKKYRNQARTKWSITYIGLMVLILIQLFLSFSLILNITIETSGLFLSKINNKSSVLNITLSGILFTLLTSHSFFKLSELKITPPAKPLGLIFGLSLFYILSLVFFWSPILVYSSFPETFSFPAIDILFKNLPLFAILFASILIIYFIVPRLVKFLFTITLVTITFVFFVNSFIIPLKVGTLQLGKYMEAANMAMQTVFYITESIFLIGVFLLVKWLLQNKANQVKLSIIALTLVLIVQSLISSIERGEFFVKKDSFLELPSSISFSKDKENVIFIIPDMFMGMYMKEIMNELPELISEFEGFVWYPNTLSVSTNTCPSICSLYGGEDFNLDILNKDRSRTMAEKITEASELFSAKVKFNNYKLTSTKMVYSKIDKQTYDAYLPTWHSDWNKWNKKLSIGGAKELDFTILWKNALFYGSPLFLKPKIYNNGDWIHIEDETNKNSSISQECNFVRLLPHISDTLSKEGNFIYIHTKATHGPWRIVNNNGELILNVSAYDNQKWFLNLFAEWMKWMKENNVYDNTKIVMVSDHSHNLNDDKVAEFGGEYKWDKKGQEMLSASDFWRVNALLMVKDYNSRAKLKTDWRFMSNSDAPAIAFNEFDTTKINLTSTRLLPVFFVGNLPRSTAKRNLPIYKQFIVKNNVFNSNNWTEIK